METSARAILIARLMAESDEPHVTASELAEKLGVSTKTILRELPQVEALFNEHDLSLSRKAGTGISVEGGTKNLLRLKKTLDALSDKTAYPPKDRQTIIISRLLAANEPIKLFSLSSQLMVTDGTISNDLDKTKPWFSAHGLSLVRKPGLGVYVKGSEEAVRRATIEHIYENLGAQEILEFVAESAAETDNENKNADTAGGDEKETAKAEKFLLNLVDAKLVANLNRIVRETAAASGIELSGNAFAGLVVHLALAVERIRKNENIEIDQAVFDELKTKKEFFTAQNLADAVEKTFGITMPDAEIVYITMHLLGARNSYREKDMTRAAADTFRLVRMAKNIMKRAQAETGKRVANNNELLTGLVNHLGPAVSRLKMKMAIRNPLLAEMQEHYPELMALAKICAADMEAEFGTLPLSEIAYIAMHLGAAIESGEEFRRAVHQVAVACPSGMGTSRLLASRIRKKYANIRVIDQISAFGINDDYAKSADIEFVISTVPITKAPVPVIVVSVMLDENDEKLIDAELKRQNETFLKRAAATDTISAGETTNFLAALAAMTACAKTVMELIRNFFFADTDAKDITELCDAAGKFAAKDAAAARGISTELLAREQKGSTAITGSGITLLHTRSRFAREAVFGIIRIADGLRYGEETIRTAIVLLIPSDAEEIAIDTAGAISSVLLERLGFIELLHEGDSDSVKEELIEILKEFYKTKHNELIQ